MSLLKKIGNILGSGIKGYITGGPVGAVSGALAKAAGAARPTLPSSIPQPMLGMTPNNFLPALGGVAGTAVRSLPGVGREVARRVGGAVRSPVGGAVVSAGAGALGARLGGGGGTPRKRYRRMNPLNAKAARRAVRRVKAVRKMLHSIEQSLPKRAASPSSRCAPSRRKC